MLVYAGIDEAGYGPMFGPLVIARTVFVVEDHVACAAGVADDPARSNPPCLWKLLGSAVCRKPTDRRRRIAVDDSKSLYTPAKGLAQLERGVLAFAHTCGVEAATTQQLLHALGYDEESRAPDQLWYMNDDGGPALPCTVDAGILSIARTKLKQAAAAAGLKAAGMSVAVIYEDRFNRMVRATRSKARCAWTFVAGHIQHVWREFGEHDPVVVVDRQGGRQRYVGPLKMVFEAAEVRVVDETPLCSVYEIHEGKRRMRVRFQTDSESEHLPVALASMTAKYVRELLMSRFNAFWRGHDPRLKPTAGYVKDGRRFLADIEPMIAKLSIDRRGLVRSQ